MNKYRILLKETEGDSRSVEIEFENHDDIFRIIDTMTASGNFADEQEAARFSVGLKMFSSVMMAHRGEPLFKNFEPAFIEFMKKLKGKRE